jgi:hypothetical protein
MSTKIKEIIAAIGAIAVIVLQIVNVLQTIDMEALLGKKANLMEQKAADMRTLVEDRTSTIERAVEAVKKELPTSTPTH